MAKVWGKSVRGSLRFTLLFTQHYFEIWSLILILKFFLIALYCLGGILRESTDLDRRYYLSGSFPHWFFFLITAAVMLQNIKVKIYRQPSTMFSTILRIQFTMRAEESILRLSRDKRHWGKWWHLNFWFQMFLKPTSILHFNSRDCWDLW